MGLPAGKEKLVKPGGIWKSSQESEAHTMGVSEVQSEKGVHAHGQHQLC